MPPVSAVPDFSVMPPVAVTWPPKPSDRRPTTSWRVAWKSTVAFLPVAVDCGTTAPSKSRLSSSAGS